MYRQSDELLCCATLNYLCLCDGIFLFHLLEKGAQLAGDGHAADCDVICGPAHGRRHVAEVGQGAEADQRLGAQPLSVPVTAGRLPTRYMTLQHATYCNCPGLHLVQSQ